MRTKQVIVVRKDLGMDAGKMAAQVAHAAMLFLVRHRTHNGQSIVAPTEGAVGHWLDNSFTKVILECYSDNELRTLVSGAKAAGIEAHEIVDNGTTVFNGVPTLTCAAFGPDDVERINPITGHLRPYHQDIKHDHGSTP